MVAGDLIYWSHFSKKNNFNNSGDQNSPMVRPYKVGNEES